MINQLKQYFTTTQQQESLEVKTFSKFDKKFKVSRTETIFVIINILWLNLSMSFPITKLLQE